MRFVLIHSPLVGPYSWSKVSNHLKSAGFDVLVPSLPAEAPSGQTHWQAHATAIARALPPRAGDPAILVAHSGAGVLLPAVRQIGGLSLAGYLLVDCDIPVAGLSRLDLLERLLPDVHQELKEELEAGGRFPTWSDEDLKDLIPDAEARASLLEELRPQLLPFFAEPIPVFEGWPNAPCAYLQLSAGYEVQAQRAKARGWPTVSLDAGHFHLLVDPSEVANELVNLARKCGILPGTLDGG